MSRAPGDARSHEPSAVRRRVLPTLRTLGNPLAPTKPADSRRRLEYPSTRRVLPTLPTRWKPTGSNQTRRLASAARISMNTPGPPNPPNPRKLIRSNQTRRLASAARISMNTPIPPKPPNPSSTHSAPTHLQLQINQKIIMQSPIIIINIMIYLPQFQGKNNLQIASSLITATSMLMRCCFHPTIHQIGWIPLSTTAMRRRHGEDPSMHETDEEESFMFFSSCGGTPHETCCIIRTKQVTGIPGWMLAHLLSCNS